MQVKKNFGFTLIELLVVIVIISLLSFIVLVSLNTVRAKARDTRRRDDLRQVQLALEMYFNANNNYPSTDNKWWGNCSHYGSHSTSGANGWVPNLAPTYISVLPLDPRPNGSEGCYLYRSNGTDYKLLAHLTMETSGCPPMPTNDPMWDPSRSESQCSIGIYTQGAVNW